MSTPSDKILYMTSKLVEHGKALEEMCLIMDRLPIRANTLFNMYPGHWYFIVLTDDPNYDMEAFYDIEPRTPSLDFVDEVAPYPVGFGFEELNEALDFLRQVDNAFR